MYAEVIIDIAAAEVDRIFDYDCGGFDIKRGMRVSVPFGRMRTEGFVIGLKDTTDVPPEKIKAVSAVLDRAPIITDEMFDLMEYMRRKMHLLRVDILRLFIPAAMRGGRVKELTRRLAVIAEEYRDRDPDEFIRKGALAQRELYDYLTCDKPDGEYVSELTKIMSASALRNFAERGIVRIVDAEKRRVPYSDLPASENVAQIVLTDEQKRACDEICSSAGKTFLLQTMALRFRMQDTQVFIIAPVKGHEYTDACEAIGGKYIKIAPSSKDCINIMEIRKTSLSTDYEIKTDTRNDSILAEKLQNLMIFFSLIKPDITQDELNLLDSAVIRTYAEFGIAFENESLYDKSGNFKPMPTLKDLYAELCAHEETKRLSLMIEKFATGSLASFGRETNVDLSNKYIVLDMTEMTDALKPIGMFMALEFVWDKAKESRIQKKVIFLDELWTLIGSGANRLAANYVQEIFRLIRGFGGAAIQATQDISGSFAADSRYGREILNLSSFKILLHLEEDEAYTAQKYLSLSDEETMQIIRNRRGEALLCANKNKVCIEVKASPVMYELITTKRSDLEKRRKM